MDLSQKIGVILIGVTTALISLLIGGFFGGLDYISLVIALIPLIFGRALFGKSVLNYLGPLYGTTILFLSLIQAPIRTFREFYGQFYMELYSLIFGIPQETVLANLDSALAYQPIVACLTVFGILYLYREDYLKANIQELINTG